MKLSLRSVSISLSLCLFALVAGCAGTSSRESGEESEESEDALRTSYGDLFETLGDPDLDRWVALRRALREGLDEACTATPFESACARLTSVRLACSSTRVARKMKDCVWVLGVDVPHVDAPSGAVTSETKVWTCHVPVAGSATAMLDALGAPGVDAFRTPLPATGASFADAVEACVRSDVAPEPLPAAATGSFAELGAERWRAGDGPGAQWAAIQRSLRTRFDEACGDSFCEGDYPDIAPLGFACAVDRMTDRVATCSWSFVAADTAIDRRGRITAGTKTSRCPVPVDAQTVDLAASLSAGDPLHTPLPDRSTSIYDALVDCL